MEQRRQELGTQLAQAEARLRQQNQELAELGARLARERQAREAAPGATGAETPTQPGGGAGPENGSAQRQ